MAAFFPRLDGCGLRVAVGNGGLGVAPGNGFGGRTSELFGGTTDGRIRSVALVPSMVLAGEMFDEGRAARLVTLFPLGRRLRLRLFERRSFSR